MTTDYAVSPLKGAGLGVNLSTVSHMSTQWVFADAFKQSQPFESFSYELRPLVVDAHGWPCRLRDDQNALTRMFHNAGGHYPAGIYLCTYEGEGNLLFGADATVVSRRPGRIELSVEPSNEGIRLFITHLDPDNYPRNIRVLTPGNWSDRDVELPRTARSHQTSSFHPAFLERLAPFDVVRYVDFQRTNEQEVIEWGSRATPASQTQAGPRGVALEYMVDLANDAQVDPWFCIPHKANDEYVRAFCELIRGRLDPARRVFVEYSNDVHVLGLFNQGYWVRERGLALGLSDDPRVALLRFYAKRAVEAFRIAGEVLGPTHSLIRVVGPPNESDEILSFPDTHREADAVAEPLFFGDHIGQPANARQSAGMSVEALLADARAHLSALPPQPLRVIASRARERGLAFHCFYGGQTIFASPHIRDSETFTRLVRLTRDCNRHPQMKDLILELILRWRSLSPGLFVSNELIGRYDKRGSWGLLEYTDQPLDSAPKYQAIVDYAERYADPARPAIVVDDRAAAVVDAEEERDPLGGRIHAHIAGARIDLCGTCGGAPVIPHRHSIPAESVYWVPPFADGRDRQRGYRIFIHNTAEEWQTVELSFMPDASGDVQMVLNGVAARRSHVLTSYTPDGTVPVFVHYGNLKVTGAELANGDFSESAGDHPAGWIPFYIPDVDLNRVPYDIAVDQATGVDSVAGVNNWWASPPRLVGPAGGGPYVRTSARSGYVGMLRGVRRNSVVAIRAEVRAENVEALFDARIGIDGLSDGIQITESEIPAESAFWQTRWWRSEWGYPERSAVAPYRKTLLVRLGETLATYRLSFTPDADGSLMLEIRGVRTSRPAEVVVDRVEVSGATSMWRTDGTPPRQRLTYETPIRLILNGVRRFRSITVAVSMRADRL